MAVDQLHLPPGPRRRFEALDGWRGLCAILVAAYHFQTTSHLDGFLLVRNAYLFVDFFFVLSGFVIAHAYLDRIGDFRAAGTFLWRRFARLWPLHVALIAAFAGLELATWLSARIIDFERHATEPFDPSQPYALTALPSQLLMLNAMGLSDALTWNAPSWSIGAEIWSCVILAAVLPFAGRGIFRIFIFAAIAFAALLILTALSTRLIAVDFELGFIRCLYGFFVGALLCQGLRPSLRLDAAQKARRQQVPGGTTAEIAALLLAAGFVAFAARTPLEFAAPLVFALVIVAFARDEGAVSRILRSRPLQLLGLWSFSIYMVHALIIAIIHRALRVGEKALDVTLTKAAVGDGATQIVVAFADPLVMNVIVLAYLALVVALSAVTYRCIERPGQIWLNERRTEKPRQPADAGTPKSAGDAIRA